MPQFDFLTFSIQTLLILLISASVYFLFLYYILPNLAGVIKTRVKMISLIKYYLNTRLTNKTVYRVFIRLYIKN